MSNETRVVPMELLQRMAERIRDEDWLGTGSDSFESEREHDELMQEIDALLSSAPPIADAQVDDDHATRESRLQYLCAAMYQAAGAYDMPVRFLDALSKAGNGGDVSVSEIEALLPCDPPSGAAQEVGRG